MALDLQTTATKAAPSPGLSETLRDLLARANRRPISTTDRTFFTEQLSLLVETGTPLHAALRSIKEQVENPAWLAVITDIEGDISSGKSFSQALEHHPDVFPVTYVKLVAAGEGGGFLAEVLDELVAMGEKRELLRRNLLSAFSYPAFLLAFSTAVVIFVLAVVFPKFAEMFTAIHDQLPITTRVLMGASDELRRHWLAIVAVVATTALALTYGLRSTAGRAAIGRLQMGLPIVREIFIRLYLTQTLRVMGLSLTHGVPLTDALAACRDVVRNEIYRRLLRHVERQVQEGSGLASGFQDSPYIPRLAQQMITTGEETGSLPRTLARLADHYEVELQRKLETFSRLAEPVMLLIMGVVVGLVVSSLILPIFKLSRAVS